MTRPAEAIPGLEPLADAQQAGAGRRPTPGGSAAATDGAHGGGGGRSPLYGGDGKGWGSGSLLAHQVCAFQIAAAQVLNVLRRRQHATAPGGQTNTLLVLAFALLGAAATVWRGGKPYYKHR